MGAAGSTVAHAGGGAERDRQARIGGVVRLSGLCGACGAAHRLSYTVTA